MNLIDKYVAEVGRNLPEKDRSDIEAEIRSVAEDMVAERGRQTSEAGEEQIIAKVLEELGDPRLLAYKYAFPRRYLIGPSWYDVYLATLKRVLYVVLPIFAAVTFVLAMAGNPLHFLNAFGKAFGGAFGVGVQIIFWMTLVFALLERSDAIPDGPAAASTGKWTVAQLPDLPRKRQIPVGESIMNIAFLLVVMLWIALPSALAYFQGGDGLAPILNPDLWSFWLPLLFVIMGLTLVHDIFQLKIGNWTRPLMVTNVILGIISIIYIAALVLTQDVVNPAFLTTMQSSGSQNPVTWAAWTANITAVILIGIYSYDIINSVRLARRYQMETRQA